MNEKRVLDKISRFLKKEFKSRNAKCAIIGISGGIDSSVTAHIAANSLGPDKVFGLLLPDYSVTPKSDMNHGIQVSEKLGINYNVIDIGEGKKQIIKNFPNNKLAKANFLVRLRMAILYYYATVKGGVVVGTADKSELQLGYFTKYGDGGADLFPIGDLYKTEVRMLAKYLEIPQNIIEKKSSARLWRGQTTEGEIGVPYEKIDIILKHINSNRISANSKVPQINDIDEKHIKIVVEWIKNNKHKHEFPIPTCKLNIK